MTYGENNLCRPCYSFNEHKREEKIAFKRMNTRSEFRHYIGSYGDSDVFKIVSIDRKRGTAVIEFDRPLSAI